jgi:hypothetical protein
VSLSFHLDKLLARKLPRTLRIDSSTLPRMTSLIVIVKSHEDTKSG